MVPLHLRCFLSSSPFIRTFSLLPSTPHHLSPPGYPHLTSLCLFPSFLRPHAQFLTSFPADTEKRESLALAINSCVLRFTFYTSLTSLSPHYLLLPHPLSYHPHLHPPLLIEMRGNEATYTPLRSALSSKYSLV